MLNKVKHPNQLEKQANALQRVDFTRTMRRIFCCVQNDNRERNNPLQRDF